MKFADLDSRSRRADFPAMLSGKQGAEMAASIPNLLKTYTTLEVGKNGYESILNVITDLPIDPRQDGFDADKVSELANAVAGLLTPGNYERAIVFYKAKT